MELYFVTIYNIPERFYQYIPINRRKKEYSYFVLSDDFSSVDDMALYFFKEEFKFFDRKITLRTGDVIFKKYKCPKYLEALDTEVYKTSFKKTICKPENIRNVG